MRIENDYKGYVFADGVIPRSSICKTFSPKLKRQNFLPFPHILARGVFFLPEGVFAML